MSHKRRKRGFFLGAETGKRIDWPIIEHGLEVFKVKEGDMVIVASLITAPSIDRSALLALFVANKPICCC